MKLIKFLSTMFKTTKAVVIANLVIVLLLLQVTLSTQSVLTLLSFVLVLFVILFYALLIFNKTIAVLLKEIKEHTETFSSLRKTIGLIKSDIIDLKGLKEEVAQLKGLEKEVAQLKESLTKSDSSPDSKVVKKEVKKK